MSDSILCPICRWESKDPVKEGKLDLHIKYGHTEDEINAAVDDGRLIEINNEFTPSQPNKETTNTTTTKIANRITLEEEIRSAINRNSAENGSNTPDFILATYLIDCLNAFDKAVNYREKLCSPKYIVTKLNGIEPNCQHEFFKCQVPAGDSCVPIYHQVCKLCHWDNTKKIVMPDEIWSGYAMKQLERQKDEIFSDNTKKYLDSLPKCDYVIGYAKCTYHKECTYKKESKLEK